MTSLYGTVLVLGLGAALGFLLMIGAIVHGQASSGLGSGSPGTPLSSVAYVREVNAALRRYDVARRDGDRLLTEHDADPLLAKSVEWQQSFGRVVQEHHRVHVQIQALSPPPGAEEVQQCLVDGLRLTATGEGLLSEAFEADGHHAYFLSAHGNWDLNLGDRDVARCRASLASLGTPG